MVIGHCIALYIAMGYMGYVICATSSSMEIPTNAVLSGVRNS